MYFEDFRPDAVGVRVVRDTYLRDAMHLFHRPIDATMNAHGGRMARVRYLAPYTVRDGTGLPETP